MAARRGCPALCRGVRDTALDGSAPIAGALEPTGMLVAFSEFGSGGDPQLAALVTAATMAIQFAAAFAYVRRSTPLFLTVGFAALFWWTAFDLLDADNTLTALVLGCSLLLAAIGVDRTRHSSITGS